MIRCCLHPSLLTMTAIYGYHHLLLTLACHYTVVKYSGLLPCFTIKACISMAYIVVHLKGSEAKWSNPRPPWLYPPEMKMLSKSVSRAGENSVILKFEHFGRRGYTFFFLIFWAFQATFNCGIDHSGSQPFICEHLIVSSKCRSALL